MAEKEKPAKAGKAEKPEGAAAGQKQGKPDKAAAGKAAAKGKGDKGGKGEAQAAPAPRPKDYKPRMKTHYEKVVREEMAKSFGYKNHMQIPKVEKIVLNMGVGEAVNDRKKVDAAAKDLAMIAGQRPVVTRARKSIAVYKLRDGMAIGTKVTLRGDRMYEFIDRLVTIALPRVKDFRGLNPKSFDGRGNFAMGLKEHIVFPEIDYDQVDQIWGLDVIVCTTAKNRRRSARAVARLQLPVPHLGLDTMAKQSSVNKNNHRRKLVAQYAAKRKRLKEVAADRSKPAEERFAARLKLAQMPRNSSKTRIRNRCELTGRVARLLSQAQGVPQHAARAGEPGADPRHGQVELVGGTTRYERSARRYADPHPQRADAPPAEGVDADLQAARARAGRAGGRGLYPRLRARRTQGRPA